MKNRGLQIQLEKLNYTFTKKPLLVGGAAMQYYGLRLSGDDVDLVACEEDVVSLIHMYPNKVKSIYADLGVCPFEFEIWRTISLLDYEYLIEGAGEEDGFFIISLTNLLLMKSLAMIDKEAYLSDVKLIASELAKNFGGRYDAESSRVKGLMRGVDDVVYLERV